MEQLQSIFARKINFTNVVPAGNQFESSKNLSSQ